MALALVFFSIGAARGEVSFGLFFIIPFVSGSGAFAGLGMLFLILAMLSWFLSQPFEAAPLGGLGLPGGQGERRVETKSGGVLFIGPIPIIFGSDAKTARWVSVLGFLFFIILLLVMWAL